MIKCNDWPISACTWSLGNDFDKLNALAEKTQINHLHLALRPALEEDGENYLAKVRQTGYKITATMIDFPTEDYSTMDAIKVTGGIVPDQHWDDNRKLVLDAIALTAELGEKYLTTHFGFLDLEDRAAADKLLDRTKLLADEAAKKNVTLLMETGQESAEELGQFLGELNHPALAVNFDPANMILYDKGDPIEAVRTLAPWIKHIHIKDGIKTQTPGSWGTEVPWGDGEVNADNFLNTLKQINYTGALAIEREAGDDRIGDMALAAERLIAYPA